MAKHQTDILIVSNTSFPYGEAETNRILSYAIPLAQRLSVTFLCSGADFSLNPDNHDRGEFRGIEYMYAPGAQWDPGWSKWRKGLSVTKGLINTVRTVLARKPRAIMTTFKDGWRLDMITRLARAVGARLIVERTELWRDMDHDRKQRIINQYNRVDGILCISRQIRDFFDQLDSRVERFHLPMSVDFSRFVDDAPVPRDTDRYFAMCSGNNWERDGAIDSLNAFVRVHAAHPDVKLKVAGNINDQTPYNARFKALLEANADNGVEYVGRLTSDQVPGFLKRSIGALVTPHRDYVTGGFPTKLGEFLAVGHPVVCTAVSEIPMYLDDTNAYVCQPNDVDAIADRMEYIVDHPTEAARIGLAGQQTAMRAFNVGTYIDELVRFVMPHKHKS